VEVITLRIEISEPSDAASRVRLEELAEHLIEELTGDEYWPDAAEEATAPYVIEQVEWMLYNAPPRDDA